MGLDLTFLIVDYVFIYIDIDIHISTIDSIKLLKNLIEESVKLSRFCLVYPQSGFRNFRKFVLRAFYTISLDTLKNSCHCVSTDFSVFDCITITVCPIYSLTAVICEAVSMTILFENYELGSFISHSFKVTHKIGGRSLETVSKDSQTFRLQKQFNSTQ